LVGSHVEKRAVDDESVGIVMVQGFGQWNKFKVAPCVSVRKDKYNSTVLQRSIRFTTSRVDSLGD
jgi:hypothetical protein